MAKPIAMSILKQIIRHWCNGVPVKAIARHTSVSRNTVKHYLKTIGEQKLGCNELLSMQDHQLEQMLLESPQTNPRYLHLVEQMPYLVGELSRTGVNRWVLWNEYKTRYPDGYQYSQFCYHLNNYLKTQNATLHIEQTPADKLYVDFAGKHMQWVDRSTGEVHKVEIFVSILGYSQLTYAQACSSQKQVDFITALDNALHYLGGVPKAIVPDNMKTAVIKADRYEPTVNQTLSDLANHYHTTILPARSKKPRDKALAEQMVRTVYSRIFAPLRDRLFYSLQQLNQAISEQLEVHNHTPLQGRDYSRRDRFRQEQPHLLSLPAERFQMKQFRWMKVMKNCHIRLSQDKHYYSVPYRHIGHKVKIEYTQNQVSVYHNFQRIAFHTRNRRPYGYSTIKEHLPSHHRFVSEWSAEKFLSWAGGIDPHLRDYIEKVIETKPYPEQAYRSCVGILSFAKKVGSQRLIAACQRAAHFGAYNYKTIEGIIHNRLDEQPPPSTQLDLPLPKHDNIRGQQDYQ
jgi:transposase